MKISKNCFVVYGLTTIPPWMVNAGIVVGKEKTLVVDCGGNYLSAQTIYGYAKAIKPTNKIVAINTEPHFDHTGGNCFFREMGVDIYGHKDICRDENELQDIKNDYNKCIVDKIRKDRNEEDLVFLKTKIKNPNIRVSDDFIMNLGELNVKVILTPGHTKMNLSVFVTEDNVLFCGDTIISDYLPNMEDGNADDWKEWLISIKKIENLAPEIIVPGHGEILENEKQKEEIVRVERILKDAIEQVSR